MGERVPILVIEDDLDYRAILADELRLHGFEVTQATNGQEGLKCARKKKPEVVLLDWEMPGMDGLEVLSDLKYDPATKDIPVFMLTGHSMMAEVERAFDIGADDYIPKPNDVAGLAKRVIAKLRACRERKSTTPSTTG